MPKVAKELGPLEVKRLSHPGGTIPKAYPVGGVNGLMLQVTPNGAKSWLLRVTIGDKRRTLGLGSYPTVTLAEARERARVAHGQIWQGLDPVAERKAARAALARRMTFGEAVERTLEAKLAEFRNEKHKAQWRSTLDTYARPVIGDLPVDQIEVADVARVLSPIWQEKTETASRLRGRIEAVLAWATVSGHRSGDNPARWKGNLDALLPKPGKLAKTEHHGALALTEVADWFVDLRQREGMGARALEFLAMTAARSGEVRGATWQEIDLDAGMWTIPAARMKASKEHRVPLPAEAVALLRALPRDGELVFPAVRGGQLSDMTLSAVMRRMHEDKAARDVKAGIAADKAGWLDPRSGRPAVPHGCRSTFRDWCAERGVDRDLAEIALAHVVGSEVERSYRRTDLVERRRALMASWGAFLQGESTGKVVNLRV
jgi:integrase